MRKSIKTLIGCALVFALALTLMPVMKAQAKETVGFFEVNFKDKDKTCEITKYTGDEVNLVIPDELNGYKVVSIKGFNDKKFLQTVKLPKYLKTIDSSCFSGCQNLKEVTIPGSVEVVQGFSRCSKLEKVVISKGTVTIGDYAFSECSSLGSVTIPSTVKKIGRYAFRKTTALKSVKLPSALESIGGESFTESGITELIIPDSVTSTGTIIAGSCPNLTKVSFGKGLLECCGVRNCPKLVELDFSRAIYCRSLDGFDKNEALESVTMPVNLEKIEDSCFSNCKNLKSVKLNEGLAVIANHAFSGCGLSEVHLPKTLQGFWTYSFDADKITKMVCDASIINTKHIFNNYGKYTFEVYDNSEFLEYYRDGYQGKAAGGKSLEYVVKEAIPSTGLKLNKETVVLWEGTPQTVKATLTPANTTDSVCWESSNERIVHVNQNGQLFYVGEGSAVVTARTVSGQIKQVNVIAQKLPTSLRVIDSSKKDVTSITLAKGKSISLSTIVDKGRTDVKVKWKSSKKSVATVSASGKITAKKKGKCKIYCTTEVGDLKITINVVVK